MSILGQRDGEKDLYLLVSGLETPIAMKDKNQHFEQKSPERLCELFDDDDISDGSDLLEYESSPSSEDDEIQEENSSNYYCGVDRFEWPETPPERRGKPLAQYLVREAAGPTGAAERLQDKTPLSLYEVCSSLMTCH
ncbi:hypothetical protein QAD02_001802 [Eretmocerus hayati]|uniref:Uncharacterized protein n=1 Tax=Eretmocerus hayati TaxID=131215 RepID=A0ACC2NI10_9HYME|nr:hypothetical protein QAD02_001802 [Eretmocerus hayati]